LETEINLAKEFKLSMPQKGLTNAHFAFLMAGASLLVWLVAGLLLDTGINVDRTKGRLSELETLGEFLFNDVSLSEPPGLSCAGCHDGRLQRQGNNKSPIAAIALGSQPHVFGNRNPPSILYALYVPPFEFKQVKSATGEAEIVPTGGLFLDGRAQTLEAQSTGPLLNKLEMNNGDAYSFAARLAVSPSAPRFRAVFGDIFSNPELAMEKFALAIATYERTPEFRPFGSKFDKVLRGEARFSVFEEEGFRLFKDPQKGNCLSCHVGKPGSRNPEDWLLTDFTYDTLAVPRNADMPFTADPRHFDLGLCVQKGITLRMPSGFDINSLCGAFRVPSLRNVAVTGPYFHNGSIKTLREAVAFYATRDAAPAKWYGASQGYNDLPRRYWKNVNRSEVPYDAKDKPYLTEKDIDALVAFLETLTDPQSE
jgi:cytochrome c peroxidase